MKKEYAVTVRRTVSHDFTVYVRADNQDDAIDAATAFVAQNSNSTLDKRKVMTGRSFDVQSHHVALGAVVDVEV